ncbi:unnamed protein product [Coffea canephora]|uniref:DH200=94 genomic scaffold, scaffold_228 n=1 Tax=Coffea canephora TaxID=49390 RepID=A0A068VC82_COFCA|nr:unnamed protein product [Coffea canephora]
MIYVCILCTELLRRCLNMIQLREYIPKLRFN